MPPLLSQTRRPAGQARYRVIAEDVVQRIVKGEWAPGTRIPSSRELEKVYRVRRRTILHALQVVRQQGFLRFGQRQQPVAEVGSSLSELFNDTIVVLFSRPLEKILHEEPGWRAAIYQGILQGAYQAGLQLLTLQGTRWGKEVPTSLLNLPLYGVLLVACPFKTELLRKYEAFQCPVVLLDWPALELNDKLHLIAVANFEAAFDATARLIKLGHRHIAFLRSVSALAEKEVNIKLPMDRDSSERSAGFEAACRKAGFAKSQYRTFTAVSTTRDSSTLRELLGTTPRFTAIITANAALAQATAQFSAKVNANVEVPRDLSIATFHDPMELAGRNWSGPQTDFSEFGRKAIQLLKSKPASPQLIRIPCTWHNGETIQRPGK